MYLCKEEKEKIINCCLNYRIYKYIKRINYNEPKSLNYNEDYLGVVVLPILYVSQCTKEETGSGLFFADIQIIRDPSYEKCLSYLHSFTRKDVIATKPNSPGLHTLFIVKEIAHIVLNYMDLIFEIKDPKLVKVYKSRKGFGDKMSKLSSNENDYRYRVLKH
jgi:hypothetical protein